jgi:tungstate transport system permease protein
MLTGQAPSLETWVYAMAALVGAMIGTMVGLRWLSQTVTRYVLAAILTTAGLQLLFFQTCCDSAADHCEMRDFLEIVGLSIGVSLTATAIATIVSLPFGAMLAIFAFRGRRLLVVLINAFFGLPPVVVGLVLYLALSRSGPLGSLALLFTPAAMVVAQTILAIPIITALVHRAGERAWARYGDELISDGASRWQAVPQILMIIRADLVTAILAGFGRTVSEVGAVILVGGNIRGLTRTMTTAIALQTSQGDLSLALALGAVLIGISISISATVFALAGQARTAGSDEA